MVRRDVLRVAGGTALVGAASAGMAGRLVAATIGDGPAVPSPIEHGAKSLDLGWRFHPGDIPFPRIVGHEDTYNSAKAGNARGAAAIAYDDSDWRELDLPHDWAIETPPDPSENLSQGYRKRGIGWYRRALRLDPAQRGRYLEIQFGGIATNATIWFNGNVVTHNWSGYNAIDVDITAMARFGDDLNSIVVRVDADALEGWWYEGAGIYRHTWLIDRAPVHIATDGVHADPRRDADGRWRLPVTATLGNIGKADMPVELRAELIDDAGAVVGRGSATGIARMLEPSTASLAIADIAPALWSIETPTLYRVRTSLWVAGKPVDERVTACGFRTIRFDADKGFFLNDRSVKVKGVCIHQDHAGVGTAVPDALVDWRVRRLKELGCNAIRSSHNAPDTALLDACDRLGMLVLDENRAFNVSPDYVAQLEWLVRRDRNRPCVFLWSVFNEEPMQATEAGYEMVRRMVASVKKLDDSRPVTAAMNGGLFTPRNVSQAVDVVGFNYQPENYDRFHAERPGVPMISSEDTSAFMTRGAWKTDMAAHVMASDDTEKAPWGLTHRDAWRRIDQRAFVAGGFVWTGFDYHGEPTPFDWPSKSSYFGIMDLCGFAKTAFAIHQALWIKDRPVLAIAPHWNWSGQEGRPIEVMVITNANHVALLLNGKEVAAGAVDPYDMATFAVAYAPGRLEAIAHKGGREIARTHVDTTGTAVALRLTPDRRRLAGDGRDAQPITIEAVDAKGRVVPTSDLPVTLRITGGRIIGVGNGDPIGAQIAKGDRIPLFNGMAQVIVQTAAGSAGVLRLEATSPGIRPAIVAMSVDAATFPSVPATWPTTRVTDWRQSPISATPPDPSAALAGNDMNSWSPVTAGDQPALATQGGQTLFATTVTLPRRVAAEGGVLRFAGVTGRATAYVDGKAVARKTDAATALMTMAIAPGAPTRRLAILLVADKGTRTGLPGLVFVERGAGPPPAR